MKGKKVIDGKVEKKSKIGCLVEEGKWKGKKNEWKKLGWDPPIFFPSPKEKMVEYHFYISNFYHHI